MFKEGYIASFKGMGCELDDILKEQEIIAPKGFFNIKDYHEMFKVVDDNGKHTVGIWFADIEADKFIDLEGKLVDNAPDIFYVDREEVTIWG